MFLNLLLYNYLFGISSFNALLRVISPYTSLFYHYYSIPVLVLPIFGVLTHKDKINEEDTYFKALEKDFREGLVLPDNRFLLCTTYCEDYDKKHGKSRLDERHAELDIPILLYMRQVSVNNKCTINNFRHGCIS